MIYKIIDGMPVQASLRVDFPNTSFPDDISSATLPDGYVFVTNTTHPECGQFERVEQDTPTFTDGSWVQAWKTVPWSVEELQLWREGLSCGPLQMRRALRALGQIDVVNGLIAAADEETREAWEYASEIRRTDTIIEAVRVASGKTNEEIDQLFILAKSM